MPGRLPTASLEWAGEVALVRDRLGVKPDELVDPDRPQRELFVSGVGGQRRGAVNDHRAGHRVVGAAPGGDAPTCCGDVAVPAPDSPNVSGITYPPAVAGRMPSGVA
jgi:hypothetical protein